jgi:superfamily II DNA or RNA helicase
VIPRYLGDVPDPRGGIRHVIAEKANYLVAREIAGSLERTVPHQKSLVRGEDSDPLLPHLRAYIDMAVSVDICVAFVQISGLRLVEEHLRDLLDRGAQIRFLTGDYMGITDPRALLELLDLDGRIDLRAFQSEGVSFHPKSYIFHFADGSSAAFVGSSNLSSSALVSGVEWNYRIVTSMDDAGLAEVQTAFDDLFQHKQTRTVDQDWIRHYETTRPASPGPEPDAPREGPEPPPAPHPVQVEALKALERTRQDGNSAGLVVLATGLGKTWLSAFDSDRPEFRRILFVAHREEILGQALATFRRIRPDALLGRYNGTEKFPDADVLFASIQSLGRQAHLKQFDRDRFDYIVVDEFHHAAAKTYRDLINHFLPKFLLGLTATPERTDGGDLLALCQENLVYRCDLVEGIKRDLLAPFHYFGVPDDVDYRNIPWRNSRFDADELTAAVATQTRAQNALEQHRARAGKRTLAFCCSQRHAAFMADYFGLRGFRSAVVYSGPGSDPRATTLEKLATGAIDIVFAVDMFNEGVDLPNVDTVMMLRPTESAILWIQQFGRGLRKCDGKSHLTVIDYIGNHRNFLNKPRTLLGLGAGDHAIEHALNMLQSGDLVLPPGCEVTYDLAAVNILRALLRRGAQDDALQAYYLDYRERHGQRPTAIELFHEGYAPRSTRSRYGSWLRFVEKMGDLTEMQSRALDAVGDFLDALEITPMTKSYKMLVLLAMLNDDAFPGEIAIDKLVSGFAQIAHRSAKLRADVGAALEDDAALRRHLEENPIAAWTGAAGTGGQAYFGYKQSIFSSRLPPLTQGHREAIQEVARELAEWRLAEYLSRPAVSQVSEGQFTCKVVHSGDRITLFLPDRSTHVDVPTGWVHVRANETSYQAHFEKIAVNVLQGEDNDLNVLASLLRGWFGADAGRPGTSHQVACERTEDSYIMRPATLRPGALSGPELWRQYSREEIPPLFGLEFSVAIWNTGFVNRERDLFLLVTLDKGDLISEHRYEDHFLAPDLFQWQSQNRTTQSSGHGQMMQQHAERQIAVHLFIRRAKKIGTRSAAFIYCGRLTFERWRGERPITVEWRLAQPVPERLLDVFGIPRTGSGDQTK